MSSRPSLRTGSSYLKGPTEVGEAALGRPGRSSDGNAGRRAPKAIRRSTLRRAVAA